MGLQIRQSKFIGKKTLTFMAVLALLVQPFAIISLGSSANALSNGPFSLNTACEGGKAVLNLEARQEVSNWITGTVVYQTPHGIQNHSLSVDDVDVWKVNTGQVEIAAGTAKAIIAGAYRWGFYNQTFSISYSGLNCDNERPTVTVNTPNGAINPATISVTANDNHRLQQVTAHMYDATNSTLKKNCSINVAASNIATYTISCSTTGLADGVYTIRANARDTNSNLSLTNSSTKFTIDTTKPTVALESPTSSIFNKTTPIVLKADDNIALRQIDANIYKVGEPGVFKPVSAYSSGPVNGQSSYTHVIDITDLADGEYYIKFNASDQASNKSSTTTFNFTVDSTRPTIAVTSPADNAVTNGSFLIEGTASDANGVEKVLITIGKRNSLGVFAGYVFQDMVATWDGVNFSYQVVDLPEFDGTYYIRAKAVDPAGNFRQAGKDGIVVDSTAPVLTIDPLTTTNQSPAITGTVDDPDATVFVILNGTTYTATNSGTGTWSFVVPTTLAAGSYQVQAFAVDTVGNETDPYAIETLTIVLPLSVPGSGGLPAAIPVLPSGPAAITTPNSTTTTGESDQSDTSVLGVQSETDKDILGASAEENTAAIKPSAQGWNIYGLAWYWWLLILAALAAGLWWLIARRRRNSEEA